MGMIKEKDRRNFYLCVKIFKACNRYKQINNVNFSTREDGKNLQLKKESKQYLIQIDLMVNSFNHLKFFLFIVIQTLP